MNHTPIPRATKRQLNEQWILNLAESEKLKGSYDFLGLNYYTSLYATDSSTGKSGPPNYITDMHTDTPDTSADGKLIGPKVKNIVYMSADGKLNGPKTEIDAGWIYICPEGIYKLLCFIKKRYNDPPIYITENGDFEPDDYNKTVSKARADETRITYHSGHLKEIKRAMIEQRVNVKAYFVWSLLDNFERTDGYTLRFGLVYVNFKDDQLSRYPKESALWFMNFLDKKKLETAEYALSGGLLVKHAMDIIYTHSSTGCGEIWAKVCGTRRSRQS